MAVARLHPTRTALLLIDVQERLFPAMDGGDAMLERAGCLVDGFAVLGLPVIVTEQYRGGLGPTVPELAGRASEDCGPFEKMLFSALVEPVRDRLERRDIRCVLLAGIEAHVCVLQTALDLVDAGFVAAVAVDAVASRRASDRRAAVERMIQAGVLPTTAESTLLEIVGEAGTDRFRRVLALIK